MVTRRAVVGGVGLGVAIAFAGCLRDDEFDETDPEDVVEAYLNAFGDTDDQNEFFERIDPLFHEESPIVLDWTHRLDDRTASNWEEVYWEVDRVDLVGEDLPEDDLREAITLPATVEEGPDDAVISAVVQDNAIVYYEGTYHEPGSDGNRVEEQLLLTWDPDRWVIFTAVDR